MGVVNSDIPVGLTAGVRTLFAESLLTANNAWEPLAMTVKSDKFAENYNWLDGLPQMKEFLDARQAAGLKETSFSLVNKTWEATLEIDRATLEDEQYGQIRLQVQMLANQAATHKEQLLMTLIENGETGKAADGVAFFGAHSTGTNVGNDAFSATALQAAKEAMARFKDSNNNYLRVIPDTIVIPPELEGEVLETVGSDVVVVRVGDGTASSGATASTDYVNIQKGRWKVIVSPFITTATRWAIFDTSKPVKPFIHQDRVPARLEAPGDETDGQRMSDLLFTRNKLQYGVYARYAMGYGLWQLGYENAP